MHGLEIFQSVFFNYFPDFVVNTTVFMVTTDTCFVNHGKYDW